MAGKRKYIFAQGSFYLQGILDDINDQDTSFLDYKHKHMMNHSLVPGLILIFLETVWVPLTLALFDGTFARPLVLCIIYHLPNVISGYHNFLEK